MVVYVFDDDQFYFAHAPVPAWMVLAWTPGAQKIGQAEVAAEVIPYFSLPFDMLYERRVIHFVDNTSALHCILNGYSRVPDTSWMVNLFHCFNCSLRAQVWWEYVASKANPADGPSRQDFTLMQQLNAMEFQLNLNPDFWLAPAEHFFLPANGH